MKTSIAMDQTERQIIDDLFAKLHQAEAQSGPRDPEAEALIRERIARQPAAPYLMAQAIVMMEQALAASQGRNEELERQLRERPAAAAAPAQSGGGGLFGSLFGGSSRPAAPHVAVSLEPVFGTISDYAPLIDAAVQRVQQATGLAPVLVGHSMGGLAIRAWLSVAGSERAHRIVTIGSPHHGTWLGRFGMSRNAREMAMGTDWQRSLRQLEPAGHYERFVCFYSHCDNIVFPASTATLPGAENRHLTGMAHVHMVDHPQVLQRVVELASEGEPETVQ